LLVILIYLLIIFVYPKTVRFFRWFGSRRCVVVRLVVCFGASLVLSVSCSFFWAVVLRLVRLRQAVDQGDYELDWWSGLGRSKTLESTWAGHYGTTGVGGTAGQNCPHKIFPLFFYQLYCIFLVQFNFPYLLIIFRPGALGNVEIYGLQKWPRTAVLEKNIC